MFLIQWSRRIINSGSTAPALQSFCIIAAVLTAVQHRNVPVMLEYFENKNNAGYKTNQSSTVVQKFPSKPFIVLYVFQ